MIYNNRNNLNNAYNRFRQTASSMARRYRSFMSNRRGMSRSSNVWKKRFRSGNGKRVTSGVGVTTQHDQRRVYRKKGMPKRRKRIWKKFVKKIHAVAEKELGSRTVVFNSSQSFSNTTSGSQVTGSVTLYGQTSSLAYNNDLQNISNLENDYTAPSVANGPTVYNSTKFLFQSGVLDVTFRNATTYGDSSTVDSRGTLEVDVYELTVKNVSEQSSLTVTQVDDLLNDNSSISSLPNVGGVTGSAALTYTKRGVTPFDLTYSLSRWGIKIWKKTKYRLSPGETFTYQLRDPKRHVFNMKDLATDLGFNRKITRILYFTAKVVPGLTVGSSAAQFQERLTLGITRKYFYKLEGATDDRSLYISN